MYRLFMLLTLPLLFGLACAGTDSEAPAFSEEELQAQQAAFDEMMEAHDRVMPRMGEIFQLNRSLESQLGEAAPEDSTTAQVRAVIDRLTQAEDGMMNWMSELEPLDSLRTNLDHAAIMQYLETEQQKIRQVEEEMNSSIEAGMELVQVEGE
jgi:hypothetical protein